MVEEDDWDDEDILIINNPNIKDTNTIVDPNGNDDGIVMNNPINNDCIMFELNGNEPPMDDNKIIIHLNGDESKGMTMYLMKI